MAPSHGHGRRANRANRSNNNNNAHSDSARMEQIITEFFAKSLHIILESRSPSVSSSRNYNYTYHGSGDLAAPSSPSSSSSSPCSSTSSSSSFRPRDRWFNLALRDYPPAALLQNIDFWRQSNLQPMVVDVLLVVDGDFGPQPRMSESEKIIERWVVQYECPKNTTTSSGTSSGTAGSRSSTSSRRSSSSVVLQTLYKKSILLLRSLYVTLRLLPAYKLFRDLNSSGRIPTFNLTPRVLSFVEPFTRTQESQMQQFCFAPVDTPCGRLCLSVMYRPLLSDLMITPAQASTPVSPKFIPDYVGSPIARPIKRIPSLPTKVVFDDGSLPHHSHSWGRHDDPYKPMPAPVSHPPHPSKAFVALKMDTGYDEFSPSLTISPSPYLSSPISIPGSHPSKVLLRAESAPDRIPATRMGNFPASANKQFLAPSPPLRSSRLSISKPVKHMGLYQTDAAVEKAFSLGKNESGRFYGVKTSCNSSPRISFQDDFDESEFDCPFVVDDDDITDTSSSRSESFDRKAHLLEQIEPGGLFPVKKSQHAAVGALVLRLKKASPLSKSINLLQASKPETRSSKSIHEAHQISGDAMTQPTSPSSLMRSGLVMRKTTTDALEELRGYKEMKDLLLSQSRRT